MKSESAVEQFQGGLNCSQAVLGEFAEAAGLPLQLAYNLASGFGSGMGRSGGTCGAVTGAIMVIGLLKPADDPRDRVARGQTYAMVRAFLDEFAARDGSIACRELLGCDISTPEGYQQAAEEDLFYTKCTKFIEDAVAILEEMF